MNLQTASEFNQMLSLRDLKAKHVNGENYLKILKLKKKLKDALIHQSELEKEIFEDLNVNASEELTWSPEVKKSVWDKLTPCRDDFKFEMPEPFITETEFKEWTKEQDVAVASVLAENLLIGF